MKPMIFLGFIAVVGVVAVLYWDKLFGAKSAAPGATPSTGTDSNPGAQPGTGTDTNPGTQPGTGTDNDPGSEPPSTDTPAVDSMPRPPMVVPLVNYLVGQSDAVPPRNDYRGTAINVQQLSPLLPY